MIKREEPFQFGHQNKKTKQKKKQSQPEKNSTPRRTNKKVTCKRPTARKEDDDKVWPWSIEAR